MNSLKEKEMRRPSHSTSHLSWEFLRPIHSILERERWLWWGRVEGGKITW